MAIIMAIIMITEEDIKMLKLFFSAVLPPVQKQYCVANIENVGNIHDWQYSTCNSIIHISICKESIAEYSNLFKAFGPCCCIPISKGDGWTVASYSKFPYPQENSEVQFFSTFIEADQFCKKSPSFKERKKAGGLVILSREFNGLGEPLQEYKIEKLFPSK